MIKTALCYIVALVIGLPLGCAFILAVGLTVTEQAHKANLARGLAEHHALMATLPKSNLH